MRPFTRTFLGALLLAVITTGTPPVFAEDETLAMIKEADAQLDTSYKALLRKLRPAQQEQLRVAERAWIAFTEKENAALASVTKSRNFTLDDRRNLGLTEIQARGNQLDSLLTALEGSAEDAATDVERADAALNFAFQRCKDSLAPEEMELVRDAQRAWVAFRDAHLILVGNALSKKFAPAAFQELTVRRTAQLGAHYYADKKPLETADEPPRKSGKANPNPFERAK